MKRLFSFLLALSLLFCSAGALAEGQLYSLVDSAQSLLFGTDNVTLTGHAVFSLDGERFKTADICYQQSGIDSLWQLDLLTPRRYRADQQTGFTIIANGERIYVMERYYPGVYKSGSDQPNDTILRSSVQSDHLVSMALSVADPLEALLPEGALALISETPEGRELEITLSGSSVPALLNSSLNLAAEFAIRRFMNVDYDREVSRSNSLYGASDFEDYDTVTLAILYATDGFTLSDADVRIRMDADNRLSSAFGAVSFLLSFAEGDERLLDITFDLEASDYGSTVVDEFDPELYNVIPAGTGAPDLPGLDSTIISDLDAVARKHLAAAGYEADLLSFSYANEEDGVICVVFLKPGGSGTVSVYLNDEYSLLELLDGEEKWYLADPHEPPVTTLPEETAALLSSFLSQGFPDLLPLAAAYVPLMEYTYNGIPYLYVIVLGPDGSDTGIWFILREEPEMMIIQYTCLDF